MGILGRIVAVLLMMAAADAAAQETARVIEVTGDVERPLRLSADDLARMPRAQVRFSHHGAKALYSGVRLHDLLVKAGVSTGERLRGKALTTYVLADGEDGYQALFSLAELDPAFVDGEVLVADAADKRPLGDNEGRFRLVVARDKPGARSVRMLKKIEVVQLRK